MAAFTKILVPLDGSDSSESALEPAIELATRYGSSVTLLTVMIRFPDSRLHVARVDEQSEARGQEYLHELAGKSGVSTDHMRTVVRLGMPAEEIIQCARDEGADLIVMSTHGTTGTDRMRHSIGSTAWRVLQDAPCRILLCPAPRP